MPGNILGSALNIYGLGTGSKPGTPASSVKNSSAQYEYGQTGRLGTDTNGNGIREVDCSVLVYNGLRNSGYYLLGSNASSFTTRTLFNGEKLTDVAKDNFTVFDAASVKDNTAGLKPGDILLFKGVNGNTTQHTGIFYGFNGAGELMFYGSQTSTGPGVVTIDDNKGDKVTYWNGGKSQLVSALRPNESLYVPQMDLSGGPNTGLNSPDVIAAVNLLKQSNVEGYRANIYSNVDGVPTVGNGLALVVKGSGGTWSVLPENQIKDLLRDAGLPESKYNELPLEKLSNSASLLNQGNTTAAKAQFGGGESGGFNVSPVEADKLTGAYVVRNVVPKVITTLGDSESLSFMEPGEFAALASKLYQKPGWLGTDSGKKFLDAWWEDDTSAAQSALGAGQRGQAEASAYAGNISTSNSNLSNAQSVAASATAAAKGHWEDNTAYDIMTGLPIGPENKVWVSDEPTKATTVTVTTAQIDAPDARVGNNNSPKLTITPKAPRPPDGPAGDAIDSELPDGTRIVETSTTQNGKTTNTAQLKSSSGETLLSAGLGQTMERDPETGIVSVRTPGSNEVVQYDPGTNTVSKILLDDAMTGNTSGPTEPAPSTTLIGAGHNDALAATNTAQQNLRSTDIANPSTSEANPSTPPTVPIKPSPVSASDTTSAADDTDEFLDAIVNAFNNIPATTYHASGEVLTLANSGDSVLTDGGNVNGYSSNTVESSALTSVNNSAQATNIAAEPEASTAVPASTSNTAQQNFRATEITEQNTSEPVAMASSTSTNSPPNWLVDLQHVSPDFAYRLTPEQISVINNSPLAQQQISNFVNEGGQFVNGESNTGSDFTRNNGNDTIRIDSTVTGNDLLRVLSHELGHANSWLGVSGDNPVSQTWSSMREEGVAVFNEYAWNRSLIETGQTGFSMSDASGQYQRLSGYAETFGVNPVSGFGGSDGDARNTMIDNIAINIANSTPSTNLGNTYFAANYEHFLRYDPNSPLQGATNITRLQDDDGNVIFTGIKADGTPVSVNVPPVTSVQLSIDDNGNINIVGVRNDGSSIGFVGSAHGEGATTTTITPAGGSPAPATAADLNTGSVDTIAAAVIPNATENQPVVILNTTTDAPNTVATPVSPVEPPQVIDRLGNSFDIDTAATMGTATGVLGLGNTLLGLANWDNASDLSHVQTVVSIYNQINGLANLGMPNMGGVGSVLSFYAACQNGDALGIAHSGLQMVDTITQLSTGTGMISSAFPDLIPGLGMVMALTNIEDNPLGVVCAALNFFPPAGPFIGAFLNIIQTVFTPAPVSEGEAHATFDEFGHLNIITDSEKHGGGSTSSYWMDRLAQGAQLNGIQTPQAGAYVMGMPTIGYKYNPDGFNYENANGHLTLRWIGADGKSYTRTYDANGSRDGDPADASNQGGITDIERDFQKLMHSSAKQYPPLAYEQLDGGVLQLDYGVATVVYAVNTHKFDGMAEHTHGGDEDTDAALDPAIEIGEGDKRLLQDDSNTIANSSKQTHVKVAASNLHTVVNPVIAPIQTKADLIGAGSNKVVSNGAITRPLGFVPLGGTDSLSQEKKNATAAMIKSADNGLFGANSIASTAMAAAAVIQWPSLASAGVPNATNPLPAAERRYGVSDLRPWPYSSEVGNGSGADNNGSANKVQVIVRPTLTSNPAGKGTVQQDINAIDASTVQLGNILGDSPASTANGYLIPASIAASSLSGEGAEAFRATGKASDLILTYPKVTGELVAGTEDTGLRFSSEMLLANDSTDNGRAYTNMPSLRISAVGSPTHGQVALRDVNYYEFNSSLGNKYAGYSLKAFSKSAILMQHSLNDDNLRIAA